MQRRWFVELYQLIQRSSAEIDYKFTMHSNIMA